MHTVCLFIKALICFFFPIRSPQSNEKVIYYYGFLGKDWTDIQWISEPFCILCGHPLLYFYSLNQTFICSQCRSPQHKRTCDAIRSVCTYNKEFFNVISHLKYGGKRSIANYFEKKLCAFVKEFSYCTYLIPVAISHKELRRKKYNQSLILCNIIKKNFPHMQVLPDFFFSTRRIKEPTLSFEEKLDVLNKSLVFNKKYEKQFCNSSVILVDDVITTGASFEAHSTICKMKGADKVIGVALAQVYKNSRIE